MYKYFLHNESALLTKGWADDPYLCLLHLAKNDIRQCLGGMSEKVLYLQKFSENDNEIIRVLSSDCYKNF